MRWISEICEAINSRLPPDYNALSQQIDAEFGSDELTLRHIEKERDQPIPSGVTTTLNQPKTKLFQESSYDFYLRKQRRISIWHFSGDQVVAMIEVDSPQDNVLEGNGRFGISIGHKDSDNLILRNQIRMNNKAGVCFRNESQAMAGHRNRLEATEDKGGRSPQKPEMTLCSARVVPISSARGLRY